MGIMINNDLLKLVRAICPDFPEDKQVKSSHDQFSWFKIINATNTLIVPPINYIRSNVLILDKTVEAITAFSISETDAPEFDWDNLNLYEAHTPTDILRMIDTVRKVAQGKEIGVDIETRRVEWEDNKLLSVGFATDENTCYALYNIPIEGARCDCSDEVAPDVYNALEELFQDDNITFVCMLK